MRFEVLGQVRVQGPDGEIQLRGEVGRRLLAALLTQAGRPVSRNDLVDLLWNDNPPTTADANLKSYISKLRSQLGGTAGRLTFGPAGYTLAVGPDELDAADFVAEIEQARETPDHDAAGVLLDRALARWRGSPYSGLEDSPLIESERHRLEEWYLRAIAERADLALRCGEHDKLLPRLQSWQREYPDNERIVALLMLALYRADRAQDARALYERTSRRLAEEYGAEPEKPLRELHLAILRSDPALIGESGPADAPQRPVASAAPGPSRSLVQRGTGEPPQERRSLERFVGLIRRRPRASAAATVSMALVLTGVVVAAEAATTDRPDPGSKTDISGTSPSTGATGVPAPSVTSPFTRATRGPVPGVSTPTPPGPAGTTSTTPASTVGQSSPSTTGTTTQPPETQTATVPPPSDEPSPSPPPPPALTLSRVGTITSCRPQRLYDSPSALSTMIKSSPDQLDDGQESIEKAYVTVQPDSAETYLIHNVGVRLRSAGQVQGIRGYQAPLRDSGCSSVPQRGVSVDLTRYHGPDLQEVPSSAREVPFPLKVSKTDPEALVFNLTNLAALNGDYTWEVGVQWSKGTRDKYWTTLATSLRTSSAKLYSYTMDGTVTPAQAS